MAAIARGAENRPDLVNWFTQINGTLTDMHEVAFQIFDVTGGLPGVQVFPVTPGDWEDVTDEPGKFSVGSYHAYDNANGHGWKPDDGATVGTHRINWRWKATAAAAYQMGMEDFEVLTESAGGSVDTYCSVADIRAEGITEEMADDPKVLAYIETWQQALDRMCRQWFTPRTMILNVDGNNSDTLLFGVPIISIDYLKINNESETLNPELYRVYAARDYPDDRRNPKISLRSGYSGDIYTNPVAFGGRLQFIYGRQNQEIKGTFGFVEGNGTTPKLIKHALIKLVVEKLGKPVFTAPGTANPIALPPLLGNLLEERTDDHSRKYGAAGGQIAARKAGMTGITNDQEILDIVRMYKAPVGIATPGESYLGTGAAYGRAL